MRIAINTEDTRKLMRANDPEVYVLMRFPSGGEIHAGRPGASISACGRSVRRGRVGQLRVFPEVLAPTCEVCQATLAGRTEEVS